MCTVKYITTTHISQLLKLKHQFNTDFNKHKVKIYNHYTHTHIYYKKIFNIDDIDVNKILVSKKEPYSKNNSLIYFIGYNQTIMFKTHK